MNPAGSVIAKIQVWKDHLIYGIKMFDKGGQCVLFAGDQEHGTMEEVQLQEGEKLLQIKSKLYANDTSDSAFHCNLVLVIGRQE